MHIQRKRAKQIMIDKDKEGELTTRKKRRKSRGKKRAYRSLNKQKMEKDGGSRDRKRAGDFFWFIRHFR